VSDFDFSSNAKVIDSPSTPNIMNAKKEESSPINLMPSLMIKKRNTVTSETSKFDLLGSGIDQRKGSIQLSQSAFKDTQKKSRNDK
jgi:hypothetical protein